MASRTQLAPYAGPGRRRTITEHISASLVRRLGVSFATRRIDVVISARRIEIGIK